MQVGFETIGNATLIAHDRLPILVTDPWLLGDAFFGSWTFSNDIPPQQFEAAGRCEYAWVSHGHPDHLSAKSLRQLKMKTLLVPDHVGGRIANDLKALGYNVQIMKDRTWYQLSPRIRALCIADYNQDGILLVDVNGRLLVNLNDSSDRGWGRFVRRVIGQYKISFLLHLSGFGDTDMINLFDENGMRVPPRPAALKRPVGKEIMWKLKAYPTRYVVPFSSMHRYQRADSVWAGEYVTQLTDFANGFESKTTELLPAFIRYDCENDTYEPINPPEKIRPVRQPEEFGDDWSEQLDEADFRKVSAYFKSIEHLSQRFDFINFRVGGKDQVIELARRKFNRSITFEAPRHSLMTAIEYEIFDDLMSGNFMKTTLRGNFGKTGLYPDFTPYVAKYGDNGRARSIEELDHYFQQYRKRAPFDFLRARLERHTRDLIRGTIEMDSSFYQLAKRTYTLIKAG